MKVILKVESKPNIKNVIIQSIPWIAMIWSLVGCILINYHNVYGFYLWMISNTLWIINSIITKQYAQTIMFIVFLITCIQGIYLWTI